jgi:hypothetical protein
MAEKAHAQAQVLGLLHNARQQAANELSAARIELEGAQNRLATAQEYFDSVEASLRHNAGGVEAYERSLNG